MLIIFDLDDTLIDTSGCITPIKLESALSRMVEAGLKVPNFEDALETLRRLDASAESARHTLSEFLEILGTEEEDKYFKMAVEEVYGPISDDIPIFPLEQAIEVLLDLKGTHELALVSMGKMEQQLIKMKKAGIDSTIFSKIVISEERDKKPHYKKIVEELGYAPSDTLVCGDRISLDLVPAKELGCKTVHMRWRPTTQLRI